MNSQNGICPEAHVFDQISLRGLVVWAIFLLIPVFVACSEKQIHYAKVIEYDFGPVRKDTKVDVRIQNNSGDDWTGITVSTSCGCLSFFTEMDAVENGGEFVGIASIDPRGQKRGEISQQVYISIQSSNEIITREFKAFLVPPSFLEPSSVSIRIENGQSSGSAETYLYVPLLNVSEKLIVVAGEPQRGELYLGESEVMDNGFLKVPVSIELDASEDGTNYSAIFSISVRSADDFESSATLQARVNHLAPFVSRPEYLNLLRTRQGPITGKFTLQRNARWTDFESLEFPKSIEWTSDPPSSATFVANSSGLVEFSIYPSANQDFIRFIAQTEFGLLKVPVVIEKERGQ